MTEAFFESSMHVELCGNDWIRIKTQKFYKKLENNNTLDLDCTLFSISIVDLIHYLDQSRSVHSLDAYKSLLPQTLMVLKQFSWDLF